MDLYLLLVFTLLTIPIQSNSDFHSDGHFYESPAYKYSDQANIKQSCNMNDLTLSTNNLFLSILSINLIPVIVIFFLIPTTIFRRHQTLLIIYLSFASGGLMANVFLRLLPHIIVSHKNATHNYSPLHVGHHQHDNHTGLVVLTGIFLSFFMEKFFRYLHGDEEEEQTNIPSAYLFVLADVLYKYTISRNLLSIFRMKSTMNANVMVIEMICLVLHLFYGYGILIHSRMTTVKAMRFQLFTGFIGSCFAFIGLEFQSNSLALFWIDQQCSPIIAGIFVYISTVHIIPQVIEQNFGIKGTIFKVGAFTISVLIILFLNKYE